MTTSDDEINKRLSEIEDGLSLLLAEKDSLRHTLAQMESPFKVGDRVTFDGANCVWELCRIAPNYENKPKYFGAKIKKDGTPSAQIVEIWQVTYKELKLANGEDL